MSRQNQHLQRMTLEQRTQLRRKYVAAIPTWRRALMGYIFAGPFVALWALASYYIWTSMGLPISFPSAYLLLPAFLVALFWGLGPALLALGLCTVILDYYFLSIPGVFKFDVHSLIQLVPFVLAGLIIGLMVSQRERARFVTIATEQELQSYALHLEEINDRLADANQIKDRFISIASHELKTPVTSIRGQAQLGLRRLSKHRETHIEIEHLEHTLDRINEQTGHLTLLIDELLDVSSIRAGKIALRKKVCDFRHLCRDVVDDQRLLTGREIIYERPSDPVMVSVDTDRMSQVIVNLLNNAVKYSPNSLPIEVTLTQNDQLAVLCVKDHGQGIASDQIEKIFDAFYRTDDAQISSIQGLGLGLSIVREIIERHGGRIWCESIEKEGCSFLVEVPLN